MMFVKNIKIKTGDGVSMYNLTAQIKNIVMESKIKNGNVLIFTKHTTTAIGINEDEARLLEDIKISLEKIAPKDKKYLHDDIHLRKVPPDERINGHSHIKALCLNKSETIPLINKDLALGTWQSVLFFELDGSREREILVQVNGEE